MTYQAGGPLAEIFIDSLSLEEIPPVRYQIRFQDSFESATFPQVFATGAWNSSPLIDGSGSFTRRIPSGYSATDGVHIAESRVNAGGTRSEIQCHRAGAPYTCVGGEGTEWYYEWDLRIPSGQIIKDAGPPQAAGPGVNQTKSWTPPGEEDCYTGGVVATQAADPAEFKLVLRIRGGAPTQGGGACTVPTDAFRDLGTFSRDAWHHILLHAKWSDDPSVGFMEVEIDGVKEPGHGLPKEYIQNFLGEGRLQMFRIGIYSVPGPDAPMTFQYDNVVIGTP
jgi:hypothetical protein